MGGGARFLWGREISRAIAYKHLLIKIPFFSGEEVGNVYDLLFCKAISHDLILSMIPLFRLYYGPLDETEA